MKACTCLPLISFALLASGALIVQDPLKVAPERYKLVVEDDSVRVLRINYPTGTKAEMHSHPDVMVIPLNSSKVRFTTPDGKAEETEMPNESAMYAPAGTHSPANVGTAPVDGLLVEFKAPAPGTANVPTTRTAMNIKVLAEGPRAVAYRTTADPAFQEPAGTTHDYDQVVISLGPAQMSLAIDGKPAKTTWARGEVVLIGRGTPHETKNLGGKPVDFIIVAVK
jgi:quercetin dioxygenase-like cupin family protein